MRSSFPLFAFGTVWWDGRTRARVVSRLAQTRVVAPSYCSLLLAHASGHFFSLLAPEAAVPPLLPFLLSLPLS